MVDGAGRPRDRSGPPVVDQRGYGDDTGGTLSQSVAITVVAAGDEAAEDDDDVTVGADGVAGALPETDGDDVTGAADDDAVGGLPATGDDSLPLLRIGAVLLAAGGLLVFLTRRRRNEREEDGATASV